MKRILQCVAMLAVLVSLATLTPCPADAAGEWGIKAGVTGAKLSGDLDDVLDTERTTGMTGGLMLAIPVMGDMLAVQGEALYVRKGGKFGAPTSSGGTTLTGGGEIEMQYVEFPVLARVTFPLQAPVKPFAVVGPSFGYNFDSVFKPDAGGAEVDLKDQIKKLDTSVVLGAGARFGLGQVGMTVEARYVSSLTDVQEDENAILPVKNSLYTVMVGVVF